ncbi:hypothetical protein HY945_00760 [Candidatus Gottesmanbacteria bacterium]|nr:hypothetical protein [Candidatus Gottesmanbacteria bacterium]
MKQKIKNTSPVTKEELTEILQDYPTKKDLDERFSKFYNAFNAETDHKLLSMEERLNTKLSAFSNRILTAIDPLLKEIETRREDREIAAAEMREVKIRLTKLEQS